MPTRVSLAELIDTDVLLRPDEAVAIVREVCRQHAAGILRGIPNATVIRLTPDGRIAVEGPVSRDQDPVRAGATLLAELLPGFASPTGFKVPGGLRLVLARATRTLDLPPFAGVEEFCASLERFAAADVAETVRRLFRTWASRDAVPPALAERVDLTISDVRRARRATGLSLKEIAEASGIPASRLRELEWGYLRHWSADDRGRDELRRYARAAGVDEDVVLSVAWPLIETAPHEPTVEVVPLPMPAAASPGTWALVAPEPRDARTPLPWPAKKTEPFLAPHRWLVALAAAVILVVAVLALTWQRAAQPVVQAESRREPVADIPLAPAAASDIVATDTRETAPTSGVVRAAVVRPRPAKTRPRQAQAPRKSFFKRELFRIVIK
jgi:hypothetical protein